MSATNPIPEPDAAAKAETFTKNAKAFWAAGGVVIAAVVFGFTFREHIIKIAFGSSTPVTESRIKPLEEKVVKHEERIIVIEKDAAVQHKSSEHLEEDIRRVHQAVYDMYMRRPVEPPHPEPSPKPTP